MLTTADPNAVSMYGIRSKMKQVSNSPRMVVSTFMAASASSVFGFSAKSCMHMRHSRGGKET